MTQYNHVLGAGKKCVLCQEKEIAQSLAQARRKEASARPQLSRSLASAKMI